MVPEVWWRSICQTGCVLRASWSWWKPLQGQLSQSLRTLNQAITRCIPGWHFLNLSFILFLIPVSYQNIFFLWAACSFCGFYDSEKRTGNFEHWVTLLCLTTTFLPPSWGQGVLKFPEALVLGLVCVSVMCYSTWLTLLMGNLISDNHGLQGMPALSFMPLQLMVSFHMEKPLCQLLMDFLAFSA